MVVLDASAVLAWFVQRSSSSEAALADNLLTYVERYEAVVPALWFPEILNGLLVAERRGLTDAAKSTLFLSELAAMPIDEDSVGARIAQEEVFGLGRRFKLTAYDATYLELALRSGLPLATFDRQLAEAVRKAGARVFGDAD